MFSNLRWVQKRMDRLDPETQYDEMVRLVADYRIKPVFMNMTYIVALGGSILPPDGAETVWDAGNTVHRGEDRQNGTSDAFFTWFAYGSNSDVTKASVERLNKYHLGMAKKFPSAFERNEDFLYATCSLALFAVRVREALGLSPETERMKTAWHHFLRNISHHLRGLHGHVIDFPQDFSSMRSMCEEFENRDWPRTEIGKQVMAAVVQAFCDRWFPKPLHWFGRNLILLVTPENIRKVHRMGNPGPIAGPFVRAVMGTAIKLQERFAPDPRVPFTVIRTSPEFRRKVARQAARMQRIHDERLRRGELPPPPRRETTKQEILGAGATFTSVGSGA